MPIGFGAERAALMEEDAVSMPAQAAYSTGGNSVNPGDVEQ